MNRPAVPSPESGETRSPTLSQGSRYRADRRRTLWSLQRLLPAMILFAGLAVLVQQYLVTWYFETGHARQDAEDRALIVGARLASDAGQLLALDDRASLARTLDAAAAFHATDVALVVDGADRVLAASERRWLDRALADTPLAVELADLHKVRESGEPLLIAGRERRIGIHPLSPPVAGAGDAASTDPRLVVLGVSTATYLHDGAHRLAASILTSGALIFGVAGLFWFVTSRVLLRPLGQLLSFSEEGQSARETLCRDGRPVEEIARVADMIDSLAAVTRERERASAARSRLARIVEESLNEVYVIDAASYRVLDANRAVRTNLGYTAKELEQLHPWDFIDGRSRAEVEALTAVLKGGAPAQRLADSVHRRRDGSLYPVRVHLQYMGGERPPVFVGICQDITEERRRDEHVRLRERAIEAVEVGILISDASGDGYSIVYANRALCEMSGYAAEELLDRSPGLLRGEERDQPGTERIHDAQARGASVQTRLRYVRKDGSRLMVRLTLSPVHGQEGELTHYIGVHEDITHESETEARLLQAQRIDAVGRLAGGIAHDFNNLLDIIIGNLELLGRDTTERAQRERVDAAHSAAGMGARLTCRLLAFARQGRLEPSVIDINEHVDDMLQLLQSSVGESIVLETDLADALWSACVDPSEIENTIVNLVINARDAIVDKGRIRIATVNAHVDDEKPGDTPPGDYVRLSVSDDGCGMDEETSARVFEPFYTTKGPSRGTGLGLASVHGFARQSGGTVELETEPGRGTTVSVYLPRSDGQGDVRCDAGTEGRDPTPERSREGRVLVVEDNDDVREITRLRLRTLGLETLEASDGAAARRLLESGERVDLVLSDIVMPGGMSGHDLARWIHDSGLDCPVLLVSGFAESAATDEALDGMDAPRILAKPYGVETLREAVDEVLHRLEPDRHEDPARRRTRLPESSTRP